jgi:recombination protein RecA
MAIEEAPPQSLKEKDAAISAAIKDLDKSIAPRSVIRMGEKSKEKIPVLVTGIHAIDHYVLNCGGVPRGRIIEVYGPESSGKTSWALSVIAAAQAQGGRCAFVDAEHALDPKFARILGVKVEDLLFSQPDTAEDALSIVERLVETKAIDVVVVDSVAALVPRVELEGDMGDANMGVMARLMGKALRKLAGKVAKANTVLIFINQLRDKIGVMFGSPETTTGGKALRFFSSVRMDVRKREQIKDGDKLVGFKTNFKAAKNKCGNPYNEAQIDLYFDSGFDGVGSLVDAAVAAGAIEKAGSWYSYKGERLAQGRAATVALIKERQLIDAVGSTLTELSAHNAKGAVGEE